MAPWPPATLLGQHRVRSTWALRGLPPWAINGITVSLGLALTQGSIALFVGAQAAQSAIGAALCVSLSDVITTTDRVARRVLAAIVASMMASTIFLAVRPHPGLVYPTVAAVVFGAMMITSWGAKAGSVAFAANLSLVFAMSLPDATRLTGHDVFWTLIGGAGYWAWAVTTSRLLQPTWRACALAAVADGLADLYAALARMAVDPADDASGIRVVETQAAIAERVQVARDLVFGNDRGWHAARETRILLDLLELRDFASATHSELIRLEGVQGAGNLPSQVAQVAQEACRALRGASAFLLKGTPLPAPATAATGGMAPDKTSVRQPLPDDVSDLVGSLACLLHELATELPSPEGPRRRCRRDDLRRYITPDEWRLSTVTSNLRTDTPVLRHALRTGVTAGAAYAVSSGMPGLAHPQWVVLTVVAVMQGSLALTILRRNARVLGAVAGCLIVTGLLSVFSAPVALSALLIVAAGIAHAFFGVRYAVTGAAAAVMAILQDHLVASIHHFSAAERLFDTLLGAVLGWLATYMVPTWERAGLSRALRQVRVTLGSYAVEALAPRADGRGHPRLARQQAYDALMALQALRSRSMAEPLRYRVPMPQLTSLLLSAYEVMANLSMLRLAITLHSHDPQVATLLPWTTRTSQRLLEVLGGRPAPPQRESRARPGEELPPPDIAGLPRRLQHVVECAQQVAARAAEVDVLLRADHTAVPRAGAARNSDPADKTS